MTVRDAFYDYLTNELATQNVGRTAFGPYAPFSAVIEDVSDEVDELTARLDILIAAGLLGICTKYPEICLNPWVAGVLAIFVSICGDDLRVDLEVATESATGQFELEQLTRTHSLGIHTFDLRLTDVGIAFLAETTIELPCYTNTQTIKSEAVFKDLDYRVTVDVRTDPATIDVALLTPLPLTPIHFNIGEFSGAIGGGGSFAGDILQKCIDETRLGDALLAYAIEGVPLRLVQVMESFWEPYLPGTSSRLNLNAAHQTASYAQNGVMGTVDPATYVDRRTTASGDEIRTSFMQGHSTITADAQAADAMGTFVPSNAAPDFDYPSFGDGTYYLGEAALRHSVIGALQSAVGLRAADKDGGANALHVSYSFERLTPSLSDLALDYLLLDMASPILPVPLSTGQVSGLLTTMGPAILRALRLDIEVREVETRYDLPIFANDIFGAVRHEVLLDVTIFAGANPIISETMVAEFQTTLALTHDRETNANAFGGLRTFMGTMVNQNGLSVANLNGSTPVSQAPVLLFLKSLLAERSSNPNVTDERVQALIEGLASPLVGRVAQRMLRLPGLDIPASSTSFGVSAICGDPADSGWRFDVPHQCARIQQWGIQPGLPFQGLDDGIFAVDVDWMPVGAEVPVAMQTRVIVTPFDSGGGTVPAISDTGYVRMEYEPMGGGDESRMMNATGIQLTPFRGNGGAHYVCASAGAFLALRNNVTIANDRTATIELLPYTHYDSSLRDCAMLEKENPVGSQMHHQSNASYEAWTFMSRASCSGPAVCDGQRVGIYWAAPLRSGCGLMQDSYQFATLPNTARRGPDVYVIAPQNCGSSGGGHGNAGTILFD